MIQAVSLQAASQKPTVRFGHLPLGSRLYLETMLGFKAKGDSIPTDQFDKHYRWSCIPSLDPVYAQMPTHSIIHRMDQLAETTAGKEEPQYQELRHEMIVRLCDGKPQAIQDFILAVSLAKNLTPNDFIQNRFFGGQNAHFIYDRALDKLPENKARHLMDYVKRLGVMSREQDAKLLKLFQREFPNFIAEWNDAYPEFPIDLHHFGDFFQRRPKDDD